MFVKIERTFQNRVRFSLSFKVGFLSVHRILAPKRIRSRIGNEMESTRSDSNPRHGLVGNQVGKMVVTSIKLSMISFVLFFLLHDRSAFFPDILRLDAASREVDGVEVELEVFDGLALDVAELARVVEFFAHISLNSKKKFFVAKTAKERNEKVNKGYSDL